MLKRVQHDFTGASTGSAAVLVISTGSATWQIIELIELVIEPDSYRAVEMANSI